MLKPQEIKAMRLFRAIATPNDWFQAEQIKNSTDAQGYIYGSMIVNLINNGYLMYNKTGDKIIILRGTE
jgi:hypothetical protein